MPHMHALQHLRRSLDREAALLWAAGRDAVPAPAGAAPDGWRLPAADRADDPRVGPPTGALLRDALRGGVE